MADFETVSRNLTEHGYKVHTFSTAAEAAAYLNGAIDGTTVGFGGSATLRDMGAFELLETHNTVHWHWKQDPGEARKAAMDTEVYLTSVSMAAFRASSGACFQCQ